MSNAVAIQTSVAFADKHTLADFKAIKYNIDNMLVRQIVSVDPVDGHTYVDVYTDDGQGNGNHLYKFALD